MHTYIIYIAFLEILEKDYIKKLKNIYICTPDSTKLVLQSLFFIIQDTR